jgi:hypothetical protein
MSEDLKTRALEAAQEALKEPEINLDVARRAIALAKAAMKRTLNIEIDEDEIELSQNLRNVDGQLMPTINYTPDSRNTYVFRAAYFQSGALLSYRTLCPECKTEVWTQIPDIATFGITMQNPPLCDRCQNAPEAVPPVDIPLLDTLRDMAYGAVLSLPRDSPLYVQSIVALYCAELQVAADDDFDDVEDDITDMDDPRVIEAINNNMARHQQRKMRDDWEEN